MTGDATNNGANGRVRDVRIQHLVDDQDDLKRELSDVKVLLQQQILSNTRLSERMSFFQIAQGIFTVIATAIGAFIAYMMSGG